MDTVQKAHPATVSKDDIGWRQFPQFEKLLSAEDPSPMMSKVEKTCRQLDSLAKSGSETDKKRAVVAMAAYGRSLDLLHTLSEMRNKSVDQK
ncbi:MAG TPA: hypothetical protein VHW45_14760 [Candidatus Sulfotelmatobacter sp.]|jgi:hypothetical protein|nr:hypothetical protein [Candidatus Sulfotelmatobacter sp.]